MGDWYDKKSFATLLTEAAARWGDREALFHEGLHWSFVGLQAEVNAAARRFLAVGIRPSDGESAWMPNRP